MLTIYEEGTVRRLTTRPYPGPHSGAVRMASAESTINRIRSLALESGDRLMAFVGFLDSSVNCRDFTAT
jgi:hypothetical protein